MIIDVFTSNTIKFNRFLHIEVLKVTITPRIGGQIKYENIEGYRMIFSNLCDILVD